MTSQETGSYLRHHLALAGRPDTRSLTLTCPLKYTRLDRAALTQRSGADQVSG